MRLDIGCGAPGWMREPLDEWTHLDMVAWPHVEFVCDFASIPVEDGVCSEIFIGDIIEHIPMWRYEEVLSEWNRVLALGGYVRGRCPNGDRAMRAYASGELPFAEAKRALYGWGTTILEQHFTCFDMPTLTVLLDSYGITGLDFSGSPGPADVPWWLVFEGVKTRCV